MILLKIWPLWMAPWGPPKGTYGPNFGPNHSCCTQLPLTQFLMTKQNRHCHIYIYIHIYTYIHIHIYIYIYTYIHIFIFNALNRLYMICNVSYCFSLWNLVLSLQMERSPRELSRSFQFAEKPTHRRRVMTNSFVFRAKINNTFHTACFAAFRQNNRNMGPN
jgi:hypothetical protein